MMKGFLLAALMLALASSSSWAYIDPGSGMAFVSGIGAWFAALFALCFGFIAMTFKRWMAFLKGLFSRKKD